MESKSTFFILIVIVAVLALSLAALAGYIFIVQGSSGDKAPEDGQPAADGEPVVEIPSEEDLVKIPLFGNPRYFNLKSTEGDKSSIIQVNVTLKCFSALKRDKKAVVSEMVTARSEEIQELVVRFFMTLTADDVKDPSVMDKAKEDLTKQINDLMNEGIKEPEPVVYKVVFSEWLFQ